MITARDFEQLFDNGAQWGEWARKQQEDIDGSRWDVMGEPGEEINYDFKYAHWTHDSYANIVLGKLFLQQEGYTYQVLWDNADNTSEWYLTRIEEACQTAAGGFGVKSKALRDITEMLRRQNTGYVLLTDYHR